MDDDPRTKKKKFFRPLSPPSRVPHHDLMMHDRRPLKNMDLKPPNYHIKAQYLMDENVEKPVQFAGVIDDVAADTDVTNRTAVLRIIDKGKQRGLIPPHVNPGQSAIFSLSVYNIKISRHNSTEDLLLRIPIHEVAAICYIKDDGQHILAVKYGTMELCRLAVLYCDMKAAAEEICSLVGQCFQLVYTNRTLEIMDKAIPGSSTTSTGSVIHNIPHLSFITGSDVDAPTFLEERLRNRNSDPDSSSVNSQTAKELLTEYTHKLHQKLTPDELRNFASLLTEWQNGALFSEFIEKVFQLYGPDKKTLMSEMSPFIPAENYQYFEDFLTRKGISLPESASTLSSSRSNLRGGNRNSYSEISTGSTISNMANGDDFEHIMNHLSGRVDEMDASVDIDTNPDTYVPGADYP